jgi:ribosomal-protein-alanine N-acetyltransferase
MAAGREILRTPRLRLRELVEDDAAFLVELLTDADFLQHIGDRGVRDVESALAYLAAGPQASYARHGHGLWLCELLDTGEAAGMCGLLRRDELEAPDIGYAWLPRFRGRGLALEAATATLAHAREVLAMDPVLAIVSPGNAASCRLLEKLGLRALGERVISGQTLRVWST